MRCGRLTPHLVVARRCAYLGVMETRINDKMAASVPATVPPDPTLEIMRLAQRHARAMGPVMSLVTKLGGTIEKQMTHLPPAFRQKVEKLTGDALQHALTLADKGRNAPDFGPRAAPALAAMTGAVGGAGGIASSLVELPVTVTVILHSVLRAAEAEGFDTTLPEVRAEALRVLASGGPLDFDDGIDTAFLGARLTLSGSALNKILASVVPGFATALSQKLAAQAVPVLGAVAGATLNTVFLMYYRELAHIRFALLRLSIQHGAETVRTAFEAETALLKIAR